MFKRKTPKKTQASDSVTEVLVAPVIKKRRRIKRKEGKTDPSKMYFNAGTQAAIEKYQASKDLKERESIYVALIAPAFVTLVDNLINVHKFNISGGDFSIEETKADCVTFLYESLHKFDASRGSAAFSYFNVVAKNWLIIKTKQKNSKLRRFLSVDDDISIEESQAIDEYNSSERIQETTPLGYIKEKIVFMMHDFLQNDCTNANEKICAESIVRIFDGIEDIDLLNKNAVMLYLRELSGLSSKQLVVCLQSIRKKYRSEKSLFFT